MGWPGGNRWFRDDLVAESGNGPRAVGLASSFMSWLARAHAHEQGAVQADQLTKRATGWFPYLPLEWA
jgi:hypothetical protein